MADWLNAIAQLLGQPFPGGDPLNTPDLFKLGSGSPQGADLFKLGQAPMDASGPFKLGGSSGGADSGGRFSLPASPVSALMPPGATSVQQQRAERASAGKQAGQFANTAATLQAVPDQYRQSIAAAAQQYNLDPALIAAVMGQESGGNATAVSPAGASGLMQLMPQTAQALGVTNLNDPDQNIRAGAQYLRQNLDRYGQNLDLALAAYNAGPGAVDAAGRAIPAYSETQRYVPAVRQRYEALRQQASVAGAPPSGAAAGPVAAGVSQNSFGVPAGTAEAACGPAAAAMFAQAAGIPVTADQVLGHAQRGLWSAGTGMFGPQAEVQLLGRLGVAATTGAVDPQRITAELQAGRPVILSSPGSAGHYFQVVGLGPQPGTFILGDAVGARAGSVRVSEISHLGFGQPDTAIYMAGR